MRLYIVAALFLIGTTVAEPKRRRKGQKGWFDDDDAGSGAATTEDNYSSYTATSSSQEPTTTADPTTTAAPTTTADPSTTKAATTTSEATTTAAPATTKAPTTTSEPTTESTPAHVTTTAAKTECQKQSQLDCDSDGQFKRVQGRHCVDTTTGFVDPGFVPKNGEAECETKCHRMHRKWSAFKGRRRVQIEDDDGNILVKSIGKWVPACDVDTGFFSALQTPKRGQFCMKDIYNGVEDHTTWMYKKHIRKTGYTHDCEDVASQHRPVPQKIQEMKSSARRSMKSSFKVIRQRKANKKRRGNKKRMQKKRKQNRRRKNKRRQNKV